MMLTKKVLPFTLFLAVLIIGMVNVPKTEAIGPSFEAPECDCRMPNNNNRYGVLGPDVRPGHEGELFCHVETYCWVSL